MVRRCVVPSCSSTDLTMLVHRFPRKHCTTWQRSLQLDSYSIKDLLEKYVVCAHHFRLTDYRHKESKHLNTTAIPTLDVIPDSEKILQIQTINAKRNVFIHTTDIDSDGLSLNSNAEQTQTYSNCVTLCNSLPLKIINSNELNESDHSFENNVHSDDIIEIDYMDEELLVESNISKDVDETLNENTCFIGESDLTCDSNTKAMPNDRLINCVELSETFDEIEYECLEQSDDQNEDPVSEMYENFSRNELIDQLVEATSRIKELETKLHNIQKAHSAMLQNLNNFNKVMIS